MTENATQEGLLVRMANHRRQIQVAILALVAALLLVGLAKQAEAQEIAAPVGHLGPRFDSHGFGYQRESNGSHL